MRSGCGRFLGVRRPFSGHHDGSLEPCEDERKALLAMRRMQKAGKSLRAIAAAMQARGIDISHQGVRRDISFGIWMLTKFVRPSSAQPYHDLALPMKSLELSASWSLRCGSPLATMR
jgi:hypothetical protein